MCVCVCVCVCARSYLPQTQKELAIIINILAFYVWDKNQQTEEPLTKL